MRNEGDDKEIRLGIVGADGVKFVGLVEDDVPLPEDHLLLFAFDKHRPLVHVYHLPKVVRFTAKGEVFIELIVMNGNDLGDVDEGLDLCFYICSFHLFAVFSPCGRFYTYRVKKYLYSDAHFTYNDIIA